MVKAADIGKDARKFIKDGVLIDFLIF